MEELLNISGTLRPSAACSHITYSFPVPQKTESLTFKFAYSPKELDWELSEKLIVASLDSFVDDPGERARISSTPRDFGPAYNMITFSVDDPDGNFRGNAHRGAPRQQLALGKDRADYGLVSGPVQEGIWKVTLNVFAVYGESCDYELRVYGERADD